MEDAALAPLHGKYFENNRNPSLPSTLAIGKSQGRLGLLICKSQATDVRFMYWFECSPMVRETWVQSQVESYQRLKKLYLTPPCLTLSIIKYVSRVKGSNPREGLLALSTPRCSGAFGSTTITNFTFTLLKAEMEIVSCYWYHVTQGKMSILLMWGVKRNK